MSNNEIKIKLSNDEAIVLFEFLSRFSDKDRLNVEHQAEERALWNLACILEKELPDPVDKEFGELLAAARERLRDRVE